ncbi:efflux RND transporter periplasmic adaptor subunit [Bengtsoniella intestinalis]|uniref:efflux RND transporter periplasmic adaptor subunit n=1 Tax=Bengtsoniella intestinalis TaxID=3073143 RepID=UPI00391FA424
MKRIVSLICLAAMALSMVACETTTEETVVEEAVPTVTAVEVATVERGDLFVESQVSGSVASSRSIPVMPETACKVKTVYVQSGDTVEVGDPLFTMDTSDLYDLYETALDMYDLTKAMLDAQVEDTEKTIANLYALYEIGGVSLSTIEQAELGLLQLTTSRETTLAQMGLDTVLDVMASPTVTAPISGTVTYVAVTAGVMTTNTSVAVIVEEMSTLQVVVNVSETLQPSIKIGDSVKLEISALGGDTLEGTVAGVASSVSQGTALYQVQIDLPAGTNAAIGMFARVTFSTNAHYDTVLIPTETILTEGEEQCVYIVNDDDTASRIVITTDLIGTTHTEVTSGLVGGETLVTRGQSYLSDGALVSISAFETDDGTDLVDETIVDETIETETDVIDEEAA